MWIPWWQQAVGYYPQTLAVLNGGIFYLFRTVSTEKWNFAHSNVYRSPYGTIQSAVPIAHRMHIGARMAISREMVRGDRSCLVLAVCGKRFSGKDFVGETLAQMFHSNGFPTKLWSISTAFKQWAAKEAGLDVEKLLHDRSYKEAHRTTLTRLYQTKNGFDHQKSLFDGIREGRASVVIITGMRERDVTRTIQASTFCLYKTMLLQHYRKRADDAAGHFRKLILRRMNVNKTLQHTGTHIFKMTPMVPKC